MKRKMKKKKKKNKEKIEEKDKKNMESDNKEINDENKIVKEFEILEQKTNEEEKFLEKRKEKIILKHLTYLYKLNSYCYINEKNKIIIKSNKQNKKK